MQQIIEIEAQLIVLWQPVHSTLTDLLDSGNLIQRQIKERSKSNANKSESFFVLFSFMKKTLIFKMYQLTCVNMRMPHSIQSVLRVTILLAEELFCYTSCSV